jgi:hypothetical protein
MEASLGLLRLIILDRPHSNSNNKQVLFEHNLQQDKKKMIG